jgi:hypothetical protein
MKKILILSALFASFLIASEASSAKAEPGEKELKGFLASEWCIENSYFKDCRLESLGFDKSKGGSPALFVHSEQKYYVIDISNGGVSKHELDEAFAKNDVTIIGKVSGNVIKARAYKAPPPEGKSFFKGCM